MFVGRKRMAVYSRVLKETGSHRKALEAALKEPSETEADVKKYLDELKKTKNFIDLRNKQKKPTNLLSFK